MFESNVSSLWPASTSFPKFVQGGARRHWRLSLSQRLATKLVVTAPSGLCLAGLAVCTWASFHVGQSFAFTGFLYLVLVVLAALYGGFWQATVISIGAVACLNYFFVPPIFSFVNSSANWVALGAFEFTALVISRLSLGVKMQAAEANAGRRDMERLYETSRRILLLDNSGDLGNHITSLTRDIFELKAVQLFDAFSGATYQIGSSPAQSEQRTRDVYLTGADSFDPATESWYCVLRLGLRPVGGLALHGTRTNKLAATALASLCGIALERVRTLQRESHAEAARQTEQLRTAVLDALAHQFKTPLAIARTASSGLLAIGGLSELQTDLVSSIDQQAKTLDHLASRLLTSARLESTEVNPRPEPLLFSGLINQAIERLDKDADRARFHVSLPGPEVPVRADEELILTSVVQLANNAIQYSEPGSPIDVICTVNHPDVVLSVRSKGLVVTADERDRVFERFYRAREARHICAGTGLGLSIVKKIVEAHHGRAWAEGEPGYGTTFSISLPASEHASGKPCLR
jgi:two-component system sensor histidine kinase KdpD